jgi:hypothetical protein
LKGNAGPLWEQRGLAFSRHSNYKSSISIDTPEPLLYYYPEKIEKGGRGMKRMIFVVVGVFFLFSSLALAAGPKSYQVTGPVLEVKDDLIVVQKGSDKWELAKDKDTKVQGDLKVGSKVTIQYWMKATEVEVKGEAKKKGDDKKKEDDKKKGDDKKKK